MIYYNRIASSEGIDVNKSNESRECGIHHCCYFLDKGFKFQPDVYNRCHDVLLMSVNFSDIAILNIHGVDYHCIICGISKSEAVKCIAKC